MEYLLEEDKITPLKPFQMRTFTELGIEHIYLVLPTNDPEDAAEDMVSYLNIDRNPGRLTQCTKCSWYAEDMENDDFFSDPEEWTK